MIIVTMEITSDIQISVVLSTFNDEKYIAEAIESVLNQTYKNFEFIIVDDGSTDNTNRIIKSFDDEKHWIDKLAELRIFSIKIQLGDSNGWR